MSKKIRIAIAQLWQEQNTFSPAKTEMKDFEQYGLYYGNEILDRFSGINELGGFISELKKEENIEIVPLMRAWTWPKGNVSSATYDKLKDDLINLIKNSLPLNGILISFHGAMVSDNSMDIEGDIMEKIHKDISENIPISISCDLHANITKKMLKHSIYIEGYHTCPHVDLFRTGEKAAGILKKVLNDNLKIENSFIKLPMITPARMHDSRRGIFKKMFDLIKEAEGKEGIIGASLFPVQPWLDVPELGWSILVFVDSCCLDTGKKYSEKIAEFVWGNKESFFVEEITPGQALEEAVQMKKGLMVISDSDATTAGAPGDNTVILKEMIERNINFSALIPFIDSGVVQQALNAGEDNIIETEIGGKMDNIFCSPVKIKAKVKRLGDTLFEVNGHIGKNIFNMGKYAVLETGNITIFICEKNGALYEPTVYRNAGLEPLDFRVVVVKSPVGFRDSYEKLADKIVMTKYRGLSSSDLNIFNFKNIPRPMFPFDKIKDWKN